MDWVSGRMRTSFGHEVIDPDGGECSIFPGKSEVLDKSGGGGFRIQGDMTFFVASGKWSGGVR